MILDISRNGLRFASNEWFDLNSKPRIIIAIGEETIPIVVRICRADCREKYMEYGCEFLYFTHEEKMFVVKYINVLSQIMNIASLL